MKNRLTAIAAACLVAASASATDFNNQVAPIFKQYCYKCHSEAEKKEKGKLVLDNTQRLAQKISATGLIKPGNPEGSSFFKSFILPPDDDDHMPPPKQAQPPKASIDIVKAWIAEGASFDGGKGSPATIPATPAAPVTPAAPADGGAPMQTWTSADGRSIQAKFVRMEGESVVIQRNDGQKFTLPLNKLSPASQELAKKGGR